VFVAVSVHVHLWWTEWHWDRYCSQCFGFPLLLSFHQRCIPICISTLFLREGQTTEAWEPCKKQCFSEVGESCVEESCQLHRMICIQLPAGIRAAPWLRRLAAGLPPRRPGFDPGSVHVGFAVDKVALGQVFPRVLRFSPLNFLPPVLRY
jgi:hypothetical protein